MSKSSIHIQKASSGSIVHNSRENYSKSVVFFDEKNELLNNSKEAFSIYRSELQKRSEAYSKRTNQKLQAKAITHLSAVLNLEKHHTLKDLEKIKEYLEKEFDTKIFQMSIHRDEGKLIKKNSSVILTSGIDFFAGDDKQLYFDKECTKKIDMNVYEISKNYHGHIEMMGLDSHGNGIKRNKLSKYNLIKLQDFVAETLQMQRTKSNKKRLDTHEFKKTKSKENKDKNLIANLANARIRDLKEEMKNLRNEMKENQSKRDDYAKLEQINKELQYKIKAKDLTIEDMNIKLHDFKEKILKKDEVIASVKNEITKIVDYHPEIDKKIENKKSVMSIFKAFRDVISDLKNQIKEMSKKMVSEEDLQIREVIENRPGLKKELFEMYEDIQKEKEEKIRKERELEEFKESLRIRGKRTDDDVWNELLNSRNDNEIDFKM